jgi:hypothetical protein
MRITQLAPVCLLGSLLACDPSASATPSVVAVADSAGVRIVTHPGGPFLDTVPMEPVLSIGREGDPDYEFFRVQQVSTLASGNIVVANGGTSELRFYGPDGTFVRRAGRQGGGPAEFGFLSTVYLRPGDTLAVMDSRRRRLAYFDSAGTFVRGESFGEGLEAFTPDFTTAGRGGAGRAPRHTRRVHVGFHVGAPFRAAR